MHILIAPNAFKNSLDAAAAAENIREGLLQSRLKPSTACFPVGDGGDGTAELLIAHLKGETRTVETTDALGRKISSSFGWISDQRLAVIEMADASGLRQLRPEEYNPLRATTYGTGRLLKAALDLSPKKIIMGIGGSATVDGATGILQALGLRFLDKDGNELSGLPESLSSLHTIDSAALDKRILETEFIILCDVDNVLLGDEGAAAVFGPQKGATPEMVKTLDRALARFSDIALQQTGFDMSVIRHGGAAGGTAAGLRAFADARLANGIDQFLEITQFDKALEQAGLVITAEGSIDRQTLNGKAPYGVAKKAKEKNIPVIGLAGKIPLDTDSELDRYFDALIAIGHQPLSLEAAMGLTAANLQRTAAMIGNMLAIKK